MTQVFIWKKQKTKTVFSRPKPLPDLKQITSHAKSKIVCAANLTLDIIKVRSVAYPWSLANG